MRPVREYLRPVLDYLRRVRDSVRKWPWREIWRKTRRLAARAAVLSGAMLVALLVLLACAGWYTSRNEFCRSCHIMEPYYQSWMTSTHADVDCIECHFAPGLGGKIRGKMLGLVQLAKYVTASAAPRPSAEIPDASCLRSGCHDRRLLSGLVDFHAGKITIPFDHAPHLGDLRRGKQLRCTSCHSQIVQGEHMTVTASTCFLCHFKDQPFDEGLGGCTHCHQIPTQEFDLGGGVKFTHALASEKGVKCAACHGDVIRGNGEVPPERCLSCHNREGDLEQIHKTTFMHEKHVAEHKVDCLQCHLQIQHSLEANKVAHAAADCQSCHPNHHREQADMLLGKGGRLLTSHDLGMARVRVECRNCHREEEKSVTGAVLWRGTLTETCALCHDQKAVGEFQNYHAALRKSLPEIDAALARAGEALEKAGLPEGRTAAIRKELKDARHDLEFLRIGNDVHNMHYATKLNRTLVERVSAVCRELSVAGPEVSLPALPQTGK